MYPADKAVQIGKDLPTQVLWNNDSVYLAMKKAYVICGKDGTKM